jgi:hypothetical protein
MSWQYDFFEIDLSKTIVRDLDPDWQKAHGYSRKEVQDWVEYLRAIQELSRSRGYTQADFEHFRSSQDPREAAIGRTYHYFYNHEHGTMGERANSDHLKVEWVNDRYEVTNGRHRIMLAQQSGLKHMPAYVAVPDVPTLERLRADSDRQFSLESPKREQNLTPWMKLQPEQRNYTTHQNRPSYPERC